MSDTQIIELDEPGPAAGPTPWRPGSLTLLSVPVLLAAAATVILISRNATQPAVAESPAPTTAPRPAATLQLLAIITLPPSAPSVAVTESGTPEVLGDRRWSSPGPAYPARGDVTEAVLRGDIYVIGGTGTTEDGRNVFRYETTGSRQRAPDLPISLDHAMAATLGGRIYVFGGFVFGQASARVFSLGANDTSWTEEALMPQGRAAGGAAVLDGRVWLVGGVALNGSWIPEVWSWDGAGRWSTGLALIPTPRDHLAVATYRGSICAAGGNGGPQAFECYEPARNEWTKRPDLRKPVLAGRAAEAAGWFWVVERDVHAFNGDTWNFAPRLQSPRAGGALATIADVLYFVEGASGRAAPMEVLNPRR